eukprot:TRINITY_DN1430_c0_g1_i2.p2 TRINITY_DN1430_c0_g1~~TRINITY_DN1430_c0_g1_i2.p2  ORF type:complete len:126 (+),score=6.43 TRINITY_DN1430_c0_g1_i2:3-380(+)
MNTPPQQVDYSKIDLRRDIFKTEFTNPHGNFGGKGRPIVRSHSKEHSHISANTEGSQAEKERTLEEELPKYPKYDIEKISETIKQRLGPYLYGQYSKIMTQCSCPLRFQVAGRGSPQGTVRRVRG